ncbi:hypothetical protein [Burkholderia diffusa]|uniref:hypothetical protein n=2 Tax=Burkholderia diffusa TaxID=488732 RepID=UPI00075BB712|nr:hypothetical protein [Burkholderia diffusa]KVH45340.1 hypothetical protein WJ39_00620 [Burkholderia diffusa]
MQARNRWLCRTAWAGLGASVLMLTGCGCWPFSETTRYETKWKSQTLAAIFRNVDQEGDRCRDAIYTRHLQDAIAACKSGEYEKIRNVITGEPLKTSLAKAICEEAQDELDHGLPTAIDRRIFNLKPLPDEYASCMADRGFKREEVERKECYVKFM